MFYFRLNTNSAMLGRVPLTCVLKNTCFQNKMCAEANIREFAISSLLVISCEPVKVESESRNFSEEQRVYVACLQMAIKTITGMPCLYFCQHVYI